MSREYKIRTKNKNVFLRVKKGHFATMHCHTNYYIDVTTQKTRLSEAEAVAKEMVAAYRASTIVDTIICLDGTEVIGASIARELTADNFVNMNAHQTIYVVSPEFIGGGQMIFRDNLIPMVHNKHVLILAASVTTGKTALAAVDAIKYYGGIVVGISAIFGRGVRRSPRPLDFRPERPRRLPELQAAPLPDLPARRKDRGSRQQLRLFGAVRVNRLSQTSLFGNCIY